MDRGQDIPFVYENGVLRPEGPVDLPEGARGVAHISTPEGGPSNGRASALGAIKRIARSGAFNSGGLKLSREQMHERR